MTIDELRTEIDALDDKIVNLFLERMEISRRIGEEKKKLGTVVNVPKREEEIISRLTAKTDEEELKGYIKRLYDDIFAMSKARQTQTATVFAEKLTSALQGSKKMPVSAKVACQGVEGSYSSVAAQKLFEARDITYFKTFDSVFSAVEKGLCTYGILPIENSNTGSVSQVYDLMRKHDFYIVGSVRVRVSHVLAVKRGATVNDIKTVCSHEQGLMQCDGFVKKHGFETVAVANTAVAARMVAESEDLSVGAICSPSAAEIYNLKILQSDVQDNADNYTRFICVSKNLEIFDGADKISVAVGRAHTSGSLCRLLSEFAALGLNLTKLESRPVGNSDFEFLFFFDFEGSVADERVVALLSRLAESNYTFTFLGSYKEKI